MSYEDAEQEYILWKDRFSEVKKLPLWDEVAKAIRIANFNSFLVATVDLHERVTIGNARRVCGMINGTWTAVTARIERFSSKPGVWAKLVICIKYT